MNNEKIEMTDEEFSTFMRYLVEKAGGFTEENKNMALVIAACCDTEENERKICDMMRKDGISLQFLYEKAVALPHISDDD